MLGTKKAGQNNKGKFVVWPRFQRDGMMVESTDCSCRGPDSFPSIHMGGSQPSIGGPDALFRQADVYAAEHSYIK